MRWHYDDGGRQAAGFKARPLATASYAQSRSPWTANTARSTTASPRLLRLEPTRVPGAVPRPALASPAGLRPVPARRGWIWTPTMRIGTGTTVHLAAGELPAGRLVVRVTKTPVQRARRRHPRHPRPLPRRHSRVYGYYRPNWSDHP